ncbi:MAG: hypothetical protein R2867_05150 [Caldilineaceae bacterium]
MRTNLTPGTCYIRYRGRPRPILNKICLSSIVGARPDLKRVLSAPAETAMLTSRDVDKVVLLYLSKTPRQFQHRSPSNTYQLADRSQIVANIKLNVKVTDAKLFWESSEDPIYAVEQKVYLEVKAFFQRLSKSNFITRQNAPNYRTIRLGPPFNVTNIAPRLEEEINRLSINGLLVVCDQITIQPSTSQEWIDLLIENDFTFYPYNLRRVIEMIDSELYQAFYTNDYGSALEAVHAKITEQREQAQQQTAPNIQNLQTYDQIAQKYGASAAEIGEINDAVIRNIRTSQELNPDNGRVANYRFLEILMNPRR